MPFNGRLCAFALGWGAYISIVSVPCLPFRAGGRASTWFPRQSEGLAGGYISSIYLSIYNNNNNNWLQHPYSKGTKGCAPALAMVN